MGDTTGPLDGVRVAEAGLLIQGPQAALTMSDWGAEVVKVELPGFGDQARWLPAAPGAPRSAFFTACNRGKRSMTVDLRTPLGREVFLHLAAWADVVITNFTPGTMERWGLGWNELAARNQHLVYATGSTFGPEGPDAGRDGADLSGQAAGGLVSAAGRDGSEPTPVAAVIADHIAAQNMLAGILAALFARERTGRGQRVDTSLLGGQIWAQAGEYTAVLQTGNAHGRANRGHPLIPGVYGIFRTADGWIAIVGVVGDARRRFYGLIGRPDLEERFPQLLYWEAEKAALFPEIDDALAARTSAAWCALFREHAIRCSEVRTHLDVAADPGARVNGYIREVDGPTGPVTLVAPPVRFSDTPATPGPLAPELGQHTEEVLLELGYSWDDITVLRDAGAV